MENIDFYMESLEASVSWFLDHVENNTAIPDENYDASMRTNRLLLNLDESTA